MASASTKTLCVMEIIFALTDLMKRTANVFPTNSHVLVGNASLRVSFVMALRTAKMALMKVNAVSVINLFTYC